MGLLHNKIWKKMDSPCANRQMLLPLLKETLLGAKLIRRNLFQQQILEKMIEEHVTRKRKWSNRL